MTRFSVCLEMIYQNRPFIERFEPVADLGAEAVEFWKWAEKDLDAVQAEIDSYGLDLVGMVGTDQPLTDPEQHEAGVDHVKRSIAVAERMDCPTLFVLTGGTQERMPDDRQRELVVEGLQSVAPTAEVAGVTLVLEPLNTTVDHPGYFLEEASKGFDIVETVDSPAVKLLYDVYHQQVTEGNIIDTITNHVENVGHVHLADVPGRYEPGYGELNHPNIVEAVEDAGYDGYFGFEFEPFADSDDAVRQALSLG